MGSALLDTTPGSAPESAAADADATARISAGELRQQAAERLAAHRSKRAGVRPANIPVQQAADSGNSRASQIAAAVAERYAKQQSYRAFLAAEAERAVQQARAAAEVAAIKAEAMEAAQQSLLEALDEQAVAEPATVAEAMHTAEPATAPEELSFWPEAEIPARPTPRAAAPRSPRTAPAQRPPSTEEAPSAPAIPVAPFAVRLERDVALPEWHRASLHENRFVERDEADALALDEEIAFRHAPVFEDFSRRPEPLPANLIEFPRQLVAPRKARPRVAEGPLREESAEAANGQLRIFEVDTAQISTEPVVEEAEAPQWTSILLDSRRPEPAAPAEPVATQPVTIGPPGAASISRRIASVAINGSIIGLAMAAFTAAAMITSGNAAALQSLNLGTVFDAMRSPDGRGLLGAGAIVAVLFCFAYQALFFTFSTATPGMRCVRIGLCTFADENPTRKAMRRRIVAVLLSAIPFGLGFIWAALDEEKLSWHDRVSGMYQRTY